VKLESKTAKKSQQLLGGEVLGPLSLSDHSDAEVVLAECWVMLRRSGLAVHDLVIVGFLGHSSREETEPRLLG